MPNFYKIDKERRLVLSTISETFSIEDAISHQQRLSEDLDFDPSFSHIVDFTQTTQFKVSGDDMRQFAQRSIFSRNSRRALIIPKLADYGMGRIYESLRHLEGQEGTRVFRTLDEGLDWIFGKEASAPDSSTASRPD